MVNVTIKFGIEVPGGNRETCNGCMLNLDPRNYRQFIGFSLVCSAISSFIDGQATVTAQSDRIDSGQLLVKAVEGIRDSKVTNCASTIPSLIEKQ